MPAGRLKEITIRAQRELDDFLAVLEAASRFAAPTSHRIAVLGRVAIAIVR